MPLTDFLDPFLVKMIHSGLSEDLQAPLVLIPVKDGEVAIGQDPADLANVELLLPVNPFQRWTPFCRRFREDVPVGAGGDQLCVDCDVWRAEWATERELRYPVPWRCHLGLTEFIMPVWVGGRMAGVGLPGQRRADEQDVMARFKAHVTSQRLPKGAMQHYGALDSHLREDVPSVASLPGLDGLPPAKAGQLREQIGAYWDAEGIQTEWLSAAERDAALDYCVRMVYRTQQIEEIASERFRLIQTIHTVRQPLFALRQDQREAVRALNRSERTEADIDDAVVGGPTPR